MTDLPLTASRLNTVSGGSGLDLLSWLRMQPQYVATPVLILTGLTVIPEDEEALIRRQHAYLFYKPERFEILIDCVRRLTGGGASPRAPSVG